MPRKRTEWGLGKFYKCAQCGKEFYIASYQRKTWVYKSKAGLCCSYKCYSKQKEL